MKKLSHLTLILTTLLAIIYVNVYAWQSQQIKLRGKILFLELAPVDPLSLVQGQYMILRFGIEKEYDATQEDQHIIENSRGNVLAIINLDNRRIGTLTGLKAIDQWQQQPNPNGTLLLQVHAWHTNSDESYTIQIQQNSFLFQENTEDRYTEAKYGMFRVQENGQYVLTDLADKHLRPLTAKSWNIR